MSHRITLPDDQWQKIATEYAAGATSEDLAAAYSMSGKTILRNLREQGVELRRPGSRKGVPYKTNPREPKPSRVCDGADSLADDGLMWVRKGAILVAVPITESEPLPDLKPCKRCKGEIPAGRFTYCGPCARFLDFKRRLARQARYDQRRREAGLNLEAICPTCESGVGIKCVTADGRPAKRSHTPRVQSKPVRIAA